MFTRTEKVYRVSSYQIGSSGADFVLLKNRPEIFSRCGAEGGFRVFKVMQICLQSIARHV